MYKHKVTMNFNQQTYVSVHIECSIDYFNSSITTRYCLSYLLRSFMTGILWQYAGIRINIELIRQLTLSNRRPRWSSLGNNLDAYPLLVGYLYLCPTAKQYRGQQPPLISLQVERTFRVICDYCGEAYLQLN